MTKNRDKYSEIDNEPSPGFDANPVGLIQRHEPTFGGLGDDDEDEFEESDRDTDYTSGFRADILDEDEDEEFEASFPQQEEAYPHYPPSSNWSEPDRSVAPEPDAWLEKEGYFEEEEGSDQNWPLSLIAVAIVALMLLTAGGYGVIQQRAATQEELRQLRALLDTTANTQKMGAHQEAQQNLKRSYDTLAAKAEALTLENRRLADTVAGLEAQLEAQQTILTKPVPAATNSNTGDTGQTPSSSPSPGQPIAPKPVPPRPAAAAPAAPQKTATEPARPPSATATARAASSGPWFVNFGSYAARDVAETWATRLHPRAGQVIIVPRTIEGRTLYRLRVVGLASRDSAQEVARTIESDLRVSNLWVGSE